MSLSRRSLFKALGVGVGMVACPSLLSSFPEPARGLPEVPESKLGMFSSEIRWERGICLIGGRALWLVNGMPEIFMGHRIIRGV